MKCTVLFGCLGMSLYVCVSREIIWALLPTITWHFLLGWPENPNTLCWYQPHWQHLPSFCRSSVTFNCCPSAVKRVLAFTFSTSLGICLSSTALCTLTIMTMSFLHACTRWYDLSYPKAQQMPMLLNWDEETVTQVLLQHYFSLSLTEVTLGFDADPHASASMHKMCPLHK